MCELVFLMKSIVKEYAALFSDFLKKEKGGKWGRWRDGEGEGGGGMERVREVEGWRG